MYTGFYFQMVSSVFMGIFWIVYLTCLIEYREDMPVSVRGVAHAHIDTSFASTKHDSAERQGLITLAL
jgi:hypothetical protein